MSSKNVAMTIIEQLAAWGIKNIYGFIGDDIFYLMDALARQNNINFFQVKHEESAALMASAHAKLTGELGVCIADGGPGTLHLLNGLADAYIDGAPVLAITGQVSRKDIGTNAKQYLNQQLLTSAISTYSDLIADPQATIKIMEKAYRKAISNKSVAHITIPMDVLAMPCQEQTVPFFPYLENEPISTPEVIAGAITLMQKAKKPVILLGEGGHNCQNLITQLALTWGAGIVTTLAGTGAIDKSHPLFIGGLGHAGSPASTKVLSQADTCLIVGANWWPQQYVPKNIEIIQIDSDPKNLGATTKVSYGLVGQANKILEQLIRGLSNNNNSEWQEKIKNEIHSWLKDLDKEIKIGGSPVHPATIMKNLENIIPADALICLDTGDNTVWFGRVFRPNHQRVLVSGKWRTMGFALPAALAAKIQLPQRKIIAIVSDGGFTMTMTEFLTAIKYNLDIAVIILNNQTLAMEKNKMLAGNLIPKGTALTNPDFAAFANLCGGVGIKVKAAKDLESALLQSLNLNKPLIIDIDTTDAVVPGTSLPK